VSAVLALGAVAIAVIVLWQPWGERDALSYEDIAPHRDAAWLGTLVDGLAIAAVGVTLALAVCRLVRARGAALATFGSLSWYATSPDAVPPDAGSAFMTYVNDNPGHVMLPQMIGFLLFTLGSLLLMGALWRSRSVPRWLPIAYLVLT